MAECRLFRSSGVFLVGAGVIAGIWLYAGGPVEHDVYFHLAIARDYSTRPLDYAPRLAEGVLAAHPVDREPIFHLALASLLGLGIPDLTAAMALCAISGGLIAAVLYLHSRSMLVVVCGLFGSGTVLFRYLMCRPHLFAVLCVVAGTALLLRRRYRLAALVNLFYTLAYAVPVLLLAASVLQGVQNRTFRGLAWVGSASVCGLLFHPHFPSNLVVLWYQGFHVMANAIKSNPAGIPLPSELLPWNLGEFLLDSWLPLTLLVMGAVRRTVPWWLLCLQLLLLMLTLRSMRFIEYWVPLVALSAAPTIRYLLPESGPTRWAVVCLFLLAGPTLAIGSAAYTAREVAPERSVYGGAGAWLQEHAGNAYVFNVEWESYPELRYRCRTCSFAQGLDPMFVAAYDPERQGMIRAAADGEFSLVSFRRSFPARLLVARRGSPALKLGRSTAVSMVYEDADVVILELETDERVK